MILRSYLKASTALLAPYTNRDSFHQEFYDAGIYLFLLLYVLQVYSGVHRGAFLRSYFFFGNTLGPERQTPKSFAPQASE